VLFGDGAGAVVVSDEGEGEILASVMRSDGNAWEILYAEKCSWEEGGRRCGRGRRYRHGV